MSNTGGDGTLICKKAGEFLVKVGPTKHCEGRLDHERRRMTLCALSALSLAMIDTKDYTGYPSIRIPATVLSFKDLSRMHLVHALPL